MLRLPHFRAYSTLVPTIHEIFISNFPVNSEITCYGHVKSVRNFRRLTFVDISDGSSSQPLNVVLDNMDAAKSSQPRLTVGQSIEVKGQWVESKGAQDREIRVSGSNPSHSVEVLGTVPETYPIQKKKLTLQFLRSVPVLRHRTSTLASIMRFKSRVELELASFFQRNSCVKVCPPLFTSSDCEGAGEQFAVKSMTRPKNEFFGKSVFLTVSAQLHLEVLALSLNRVWCLSPCFRAEDSNTGRHLSEFWMLEAEFAYVSDISQLTDFVEHMIRSVVTTLKDRSSDNDVGLLNDLLLSRYSREDQLKLTDRWKSLAANEKWPSITYTKAVEIINKHKYMCKETVRWGDDILTEHEKWLAGTYFKSPVFVTDYPKAQKPFYMSALCDYNPMLPTVACFDLIIPKIGELVGGSLREHDHDNLVAEMKSREINFKSMDWYLSTRLNGSVPHGGFGLGFERLIAYLSGLENIRDVSAFPRAPELCDC